MADFALLALPGAYQSSVGALVDSYTLARECVERVFGGPEPMRMRTQLRILSQDGGPVALSDGSTLAVGGAIDRTTPYGFIWLPAFRTGGEAPFAERLAQSQPLLAWLRQQAEQGAIIGASGPASLLLMAAGLTGDIRVPVARALLPLTRAYFPRQRLEERLALVDHGQLLICGGLAGDLALITRVMERTISAGVARWIASVIGLDRAEEESLASDQLVARAQLWLEQNFTGPVSIAELAESLSTSAATLNRRFRKALGTSPTAYVGALRLESAIRMLEMTERPIDRIAELVGYSDSRLFRAMFRQQTGMAASEWRAAARARAEGK